ARLQRRGTDRERLGEGKRDCGNRRAETGKRRIAGCARIKKLSAIRRGGGGDSRRSEDGRANPQSAILRPLPRSGDVPDLQRSRRGDRIQRARATQRWEVSEVRELAGDDPWYKGQ